MMKKFFAIVMVAMFSVTMMAENKSITTLTPEGEEVVVTITKTGVKLVKGELTVFSTNKACNSLVKKGKKWVPAIASDETKMMVWRDESGKPLFMLDYFSAKQRGWNNGHCTIVSKK